MDHTAAIAGRPGRARSLVRSAALFVAIGVLIHLGLLALSERLLYRTGDSNPLFKIETLAAPEIDWVILGASHAMPLDFADFNRTMEAATGLTILNLASPGTGPLYNRFVLEHFFRTHGARHILYVADSFSFRDRAWNEDRFADAKLLSRTPFSPALARRLFDYVVEEGVDPRAFADYLTGFSRINNRDRFAPDIWEGEAKFERAFRPSAVAEAKRIEYLYPHALPDDAQLGRYLGEFSALLDLAAANGATVTVVKPPVPASFARRLPGEPVFDEALRLLAERQGAAFRDFSGAVPDPRLYFDTDHLNRAGLLTFFEQELKPLLEGDGT